MGGESLSMENQSVWSAGHNQLIEDLQLLSLHRQNLESGQLRNYRPKRREWDAGWKTFKVIALARPKPGSVIYGDHFQDGPTPLESTPHFEFAHSYLRGLTSGQDRYFEYVMAQHGLSRSQAVDRGESFKKRIELHRFSSSNQSIAVRIVDRKIVIADGFHRASIWLASGKIGEVVLWLVAPGGKLNSHADLG